MSDAPVVTQYDAATGIAKIIFNRPDVMNAIDVPTAQAFRAAVEHITAKPNLRCLLLMGAGRAFVAGGDVASFVPDPPGIVNALLDALHPAILGLRACSAPVIAVVRGAAAGAGLSLALGADLILAGSKARFVIAYDKIGASPDCGGTWFLPHKIGRTRAFEMMLLGQNLDAETALRVGLVSEVVADADLDTSAIALAETIASGPTQAYGHFKHLVDAAFETPLAEQLEAERRAFLSATTTQDFAEGVSAFLRKSAPTFSGK